MSLINDVLRDLAKREPRAPGALSGIQVVPESKTHIRPHRPAAILSSILFVLLALGTSWFLLTRGGNTHSTRPLPRPAGTTIRAGTQAHQTRAFGGRPPPSAAIAQPLPQSPAIGSHPRRPLSQSAQTKPQARAAFHPPPPVSIAQSLDIHSAPPATPSEAMQLDLLEARRDLNHGHEHHAIRRFRKALSLEPRNSAIRLALAGLDIRLGDLPAAQALLLTGIHLPGISRTALDAQINLLARTGNTALAWHEIRRHSPTHPIAHLHYLKLAAALAQLTGHWPIAAHLYDEVIAKHPLAAWAWAGRGIALEQSGRNRSALTADQRALALGGLPPTLTLYLERRIRFLEKPLPTHEPPTR